MTDKKSINDELDRDSHPEPTAAVSRTGQERILFVFFSRNLIFEAFRFGRIWFDFKCHRNICCRFEIKQFGNISFFRSFVLTNVEENAKKGGFVWISKRARSRHSHFCSEKNLLTWKDTSMVWNKNLAIHQGLSSLCHWVRLGQPFTVIWFWR